MSKKFMIPVIVSILILGTMGLSYDAFAVTTIIDVDTIGNQKVKSGDTLTITNGATLTGNIKVNGGTLIINLGATVDGNIKVKNGGTVTIDNASVNGNLKAKSDGSVTMNNGDVSGNFKAKGADTVTITDSSIGGNFKVKNSNRVLVSGNTISGKLSVTGIATCDVFGNTSGSTVTTVCNTEPPNNPPTIESVTFTQDASGDASVIFGHPSRPTVCHANGVMDADGDVVTLSFEWLSADGTLITTGNTLPINSVVNEQVTCKVTPFDGTDFGASTSSSITLVTPGA